MLQALRLQMAAERGAPPIIVAVATGCAQRSRLIGRGGAPSRCSRLRTREHGHVRIGLRPGAAARIAERTEPQSAVLGAHVLLEAPALIAALHPPSRKAPPRTAPPRSHRSWQAAGPPRRSPCNGSASAARA